MSDLSAMIDDMPTGCDVCGKDVPTIPMSVEYEDGSPSELRICSTCLHEGKIELQVNQASANAAKNLDFTVETLDALIVEAEANDAKWAELQERLRRMADYK